jgi:hypothetical protein
LYSYSNCKGHEKWQLKVKIFLYIFYKKIGSRRVNDGQVPETLQEKFQKQSITCRPGFLFISTLTTEEKNKYFAKLLAPSVVAPCLAIYSALALSTCLKPPAITRLCRYASVNSFVIYFFSSLNFTVMVVSSFAVYYQYVCPVFGAVSVFQLPSGQFLHHCHFYNFHFVSELPF